MSVLRTSRQQLKNPIIIVADLLRAPGSVAPLALLVSTVPGLTALNKYHPGSDGANGGDCVGCALDWLAAPPDDTVEVDD